MRFDIPRALEHGTQAKTKVFGFRVKKPKLIFVLKGRHPFEEALRFTG